MSVLVRVDKNVQTDMQENGSGIIEYWTSRVVRPTLVSFIGVSVCNGYYLLCNKFFIEKNNIKLVSYL